MQTGVLKISDFFHDLQLQNGLSKELERRRNYKLKRIPMMVYETHANYDYFHFFFQDMPTWKFIGCQMLHG